MATSDMNNILKKIKEEAKIAHPGILPKGKSMDSLVGHIVINLSDTVLTKAQVSALEKGLTFCPTPGPLISPRFGWTLRSSTGDYA